MKGAKMKKLIVTLVLMPMMVLASLTDGLMAYWPFDGNANDASGNGHDLTGYNNPQPTADRFGAANAAYSFNGNASQYFSDSDSENRMVAVADTFSFALWFQTSASYKDYGAGWAWNLGNYAFFPENGDYAFSRDGDDDDHSKVGLGVKVGTDGIEVVEHTGYYMPTVLNYESNIGSGWNHVVVTVADSGAPVLYLNGTKIGEGESTGKRCTVRPCGIGGGNWGFYTGKVDDVRIYNRALSAAEVKALYAGTPTLPPSANGLWTVTQYNLNTQPYSVEDAEAGLVDSSKWDGSPVTGTYKQIAFADNLKSYRMAYFRDSMVSFPGNVDGKHEWFLVEAVGLISVPEAGWWTFACRSDDGFKATISGNGFSDSFSFSGGRSLETTDVKVMNFPVAGTYTVRILYYEYADEAAIEFSVAKGSYSSFDSSAFKLVGDPASGVTLAGGDEYHTVTFSLNGAGGAAPSGRSWPADAKASSSCPRRTPPCRQGICRL